MALHNFPGRFDEKVLLLTGSASATSVSQPTGIAPTQELGDHLYHHTDVEGFVAVSAKSPQQRNLVIFPEKLVVGSEIIFHDPVSGATHRITG